MIQILYEIILSIFVRIKWKHVGTAVAISRNIEDSNSKFIYTYYVLTENNFGRRKVKELGDFTSSNYALQCKVKVEEWKAGGELPYSFLYENTDPAILWVPDYEKKLKTNSKISFTP